MYIRSNNIIRGETPTGPVDGVNTQFILASSPVIGTVEVWVNGVYQAAGEDFTILDKVIVLDVPPETGDSVLASYIKR